MDKLPAYLPVQAVLIWMATGDVEACSKAFEYADDAVCVSIADWGLSVAAYVIAKHQQSGLLTIKGKAATLVEVDETRVRCPLKIPETPRHDYESFTQEQQLMRALVVGEITAYTIDGGNAVHEIDAALWLGREFESELYDNRYHVVAVAPGREPLRHIRFKKEDILRKWLPENGQKRGPKGGASDRKLIWCARAKEMLDSGEVKPTHGAKTKIALRILNDGESGYQPGTIADAIAKTVNEWRPKPEAV